VLNQDLPYKNLGKKASTEALKQDLVSFLSREIGSRVKVLPDKEGTLNSLKRKLRELGYANLAQNKEHVKAISTLLALPERDMAKFMGKVGMAAGLGLGAAALLRKLPKFKSKAADLVKDIAAATATTIGVGGLTEFTFRKSFDDLPQKEKIQEVVKAYKRYLRNK
tara:strand:+ start:93 stop:590 length:498 start_codon:yes stop_codon:yes gene_type:complete